MNNVTKSPVEQIPIGSVHIGTRRRKKLGSLAGLKKSIGEHGLLHPIIVRNGNELVAGARRLQACKALDWKKIPVRRVEKMTDEELRAIEIDENAQRLALSDYDTSKRRLAEIRQVEAELKCGPGPHLSERRTTVRARKRKPGSKRDIAEKAGADAKTVHKIEKHVEFAERFPFMQSWPQRRVLEAGILIEKLPAKDLPTVASILDQFGVPPKSAIQILTNLNEFPATKRKEIYEKATSDDFDDRQDALAMSAALPKNPDRCVSELMAHNRTSGVCRRKHSDQIVALFAKYKKIRTELLAGLQREADNGQ